MSGGRRGLFIPHGWEQLDGPLHSPEGPSDTLTLHAMGLPAIGRPSNTGGLELLAELLKTLPADRQVVILGEFDPKPDGTWPGRECIGAAGKLAAGLRRPIYWVMPPSSQKDVRQWALSQKPDAACADTWQAMGERFLADVRETWQEAKAVDGQGGDSKRERPTLPVVEIFTAPELAATELAEPVFAVNGIIPTGLSLLAGKPKLGKSWLALNLALAIALGGMALGSIAVEAGDVLYLALEDTKRRLQDRLARLYQSQHVNPPAALYLTTAWPRQDKEGLFNLVEWLQRHPGARMVVIDTWVKFRPMRSKGRDCYEEDYEHAGDVKAVADKYGVAIVAIVHCRKLPATDPLDEINSTVGMSGAADSALVLRRERGQHDATLFVAGRDIDEQELALQWDPAYALWSVLGSADEYRLSRERSEVLALLRKEGRAISPSEVASCLGKTNNACKLLLWKMKSDGWVEVEPGGKYRPCTRAEITETRKP